MLILLRYIAVLVLILLSHASIAQGFKKEKRIYLFDVTASMQGFKGNTPDIFEDVKKNFAAAIDKLENDDTEIIILTFTNRIINKYQFTANQKKEIKSTINNIKVANGNTDITTAWEAGARELNPKKVNYMFLLTDGRQTVGGSNAEQKLYANIRNWKAYAAGNDYYAFYVMLTKHATSDALANTFKQSHNVWPVESMDVDFKFIQPTKNVYYNIKDDNKKKVSVLLKRQLPANLSLSLKLNDNPYYKLEQQSAKIENGSFNITVSRKVDLTRIPEDYNLELNLTKDNTKFWDVFLTPETINLKMINKKEKVLTIYQK